MIVISPDEEHDRDVEEAVEILGPPSRSPSPSPQISSRRPRIAREATLASSNHTLASSPMISDTVPSAIRSELSPGPDMSYHSSGSSPGVVSTTSSPPLSPRPINSSDDLERFRDLFYRPPALAERRPSSSSTPSSEAPSRPSMSRKASGSIPIELGNAARSTRSLSGLTSLARQLSENLGELQDQEEAEAMRAEYGARGSPRWTSRYDGLVEEPEDDERRLPPELASLSSRTGLSPKSPLRLPLDADLVLSQPVDVVPEDVESSRASSLLEMPIEDDSARTCYPLFM